MQVDNGVLSFFNQKKKVVVRRFSQPLQLNSKRLRIAQDITKVIDQFVFADGFRDRKHYGYVWLNQLNLRVVLPSDLIDPFRINLRKMYQ